MRGSSILSSCAFLVASLALAACPAGDDPGTSAGDTDATSEGSTSEAGSSSGDPTGADSTTGAPDISGEEFYLSVCAPCHGPEGEGTAIGYALQHPVRDYSTWVVRNGRPAAGNPELPGSTMNAYSVETLPDATLEEIWDYLDTFPQPTTGEALYMDYCRNCHGEDAIGGITGVNLLAEDKTFAEILETVREGENDGGGGPVQRSLYMPRFDTSRISDAEVQLVVDYLATL